MKKQKHMTLCLAFIGIALLATAAAAAAPPAAADAARATSATAAPAPQAAAAWPRGAAGGGAAAAALQLDACGRSDDGKQLASMTLLVSKVRRLSSCF